MGRYFKTDKPQQLDYMYKLPEQYLLAAVQQASEDITQNQAAMYDIYGKLQLNALDADKPRARQILGKYENYINQMATELQKSPLEFRRRTGDLMRLSRELEREFTTGEAGAIQTNYNTFQKWQEDYDKLIRKGKIENASWVNALASANLRKYAEQGGVSYDSTTGVYNQIELEELATYQDIDKKISEVGKEFAPAIMATASARESDDGRFIIEVSKTKESKDAVLMLEAMTQKILADEAVMDFVNQGSRIGMLSGYYNEDKTSLDYGKLQTPYIIKDGKVTFQGTLGQKLESAIKTYAYDNTTKASERWKNIPQKDGSKTTTDKYQHQVNIKTGEVSVSPAPYVRTGSEVEKQVNDYVQSLISQPQKKKQLQLGLRGLISGVSNAMIQNGIPADEAAKRIENINKIADELSKENPNFVLVEETINSIPEIVDIQPFRNAYTAMKENELDASLAEQQLKFAQIVAPELGMTLENFYNTDPMIKQELVIEGSQGGWYDNEDDAKLYNQALKSFADKFSNYAKLPEEFAVHSYDKNGKPVVKMTNKKEFLKNHQFIKNGKEDDNVQAIDEQMEFGIFDFEDGSVAALRKQDMSSMETKSGFYMLNGEIPYTYTDENNEIQTGSYKQPYSILVKDSKGESIQIILPRDTGTTNITNTLDSKYAAKYQFERRLEKIGKSIKPLIETGKLTEEDVKEGIPIWTDVNLEGKRFGLIYVPSVGSDSDMVTVIPEDGEAKTVSADSYQIQQLYEEFYGTTPFDKE